MSDLTCPECGKECGLERTLKTVGMYCGKCKRTYWDGVSVSYPTPKGNPPSCFPEFVKHLEVEQKDGTKVPFEINETQKKILESMKKHPATYIVRGGKVVKTEGRSKKP